MLGKDHGLFLKKILKVFSRFNVFSLCNSESSPKIIQFFLAIAIPRLFNIITYNNNLTV